MFVDGAVNHGLARAAGILNSAPISHQQSRLNSLRAVIGLPNFMALMLALRRRATLVIDNGCPLVFPRRRFARGALFIRDRKKMQKINAVP